LRGQHGRANPNPASFVPDIMRKPQQSNSSYVPPARVQNAPPTPNGQGVPRGSPSQHDAMPRSSPSQQDAMPRGSPAHHDNVPPLPRSSPSQHDGRGNGGPIVATPCQASAVGPVRRSASPPQRTLPSRSDGSAGQGLSRQASFQSADPFAQVVREPELSVLARQADSRECPVRPAGRQDLGRRLSDQDRYGQAAAPQRPTPSGSANGSFVTAAPHERADTGITQVNNPRSRLSDPLHRSPRQKPERSPSCSTVAVPTSARGMSARADATPRGVASNGVSRQSSAANGSVPLIAVPTVACEPVSRSRANNSAVATLIATPVMEGLRSNGLEGLLSNGGLPEGLFSNGGLPEGLLSNGGTRDVSPRRRGEGEQEQQRCREFSQREATLDHMARELKRREAGLVERDREVVQREVASERWSRDLAQREGTIRAREEECQKLLADTERKQSALAAKEQSANMHLEDECRVRDQKLNEREQQLWAREQKLAESEASAIHLNQREEQLRAREQKMADREADLQAWLRQKEDDINKDKEDMQREWRQVRERQDEVARGREELLSERKGLQAERKALDERERNHLEASREAQVLRPHSFTRQMRERTSGEMRARDSSKENIDIRRQLDEQQDRLHAIKHQNNEVPPMSSLGEL